MANSKPSTYRFSALGEIVLGIALAIVGLILMVAFSRSVFGIIAIIALGVGVILAIQGLVRGIRENRVSQNLRDEAARTTINTDAAREQGSNDIAALLARLNEMHATGALTDSEFTAAKAKLLG